MSSAETTAEPESEVTSAQQDEDPGNLFIFSMPVDSSGVWLYTNIIGPILYCCSLFLSVHLGKPYYFLNLKPYFDINTLDNEHYKTQKKEVLSSTCCLLQQAHTTIVPKGE